MSKVYLWRRGVLQVHMPQANGFFIVPYTDDYAIFYTFAESYWSYFICNSKAFSNL